MNLPKYCDKKRISSVKTDPFCLFTSVAFCGLLNDFTNQCIFIAVTIRWNNKWIGRKRMD